MKHNFQDCKKIAMYELHQMPLILNCRSIVPFKFSVSLVTRAGIFYTKWQKKSTLPVTSLWNGGPLLKDLNDYKLILNESK